jgi:hypothetical protein
MSSTCYNLPGKRSHHRLAACRGPSCSALLQCVDQLASSGLSYTASEQYLSTGTAADIRESTASFKAAEGALDHAVCGLTQAPEKPKDATSTAASFMHQVMSLVSNMTEERLCC